MKRRVLKEVIEDIEFAIAPNRWSLRFLGIWPFPDCLSDVRFVSAYVLIIFIVIPQLMELFGNNGFDDNTINNLSTSMPLFMVLIKLFMMRANRLKLRDCLNAVIEDWEWKMTCRKKQFEDVMVKNARVARMSNMVCTILLYTTSFGFLILPFTVPEESTPFHNATRYLPVNTLYPFEVSTSPNYELIYMMQCLSIAIAATSNFSIDSFLALLVLHFCGQLEILGQVLEEYTGQVGHNDTKQEHFGSCNCMTCIVERHLHITRFSETLEASFNLMLLMQFITNTMLFCFLGYRIIMNFEDSNAVGIVTFVVFMFTMMFHLFLYSYVGEQIMEKSRAIGYSAYQVAWYNLQPDAARPLIILMARARNPLKITAGKFFVLSLQCYTDILKTSATYLSFLRTVKA